jgi:predicted DNA binding protein
MPGLTTRDSFVLESLFDPEASAATTKHASSQTSLPGMTEDQFLLRRSTELQIISQLQNDTPNAETVQKAVEDLSSLIEDSPGYASAYINRAQASRLLIPTNDLFTSDHAQASGQLLKDLQKGIQLAEPATSDQQLSTHQTTVLAAAYTAFSYSRSPTSSAMASKFMVSATNFNQPLQKASRSRRARTLLLEVNTEARKHAIWP